MPQMTRTDVLKNRNVWHTIAALPPRKIDDVRVKSVPSNADKRTKEARDAIYDHFERKRLDAEFAL